MFDILKPICLQDLIMVVRMNMLSRWMVVMGNVFRKPLLSLLLLQALPYGIDNRNNSWGTYYIPSLYIVLHTSFSINSINISHTLSSALWVGEGNKKKNFLTVQYYSQWYDDVMRLGGLFCGGKELRFAFPLYPPFLCTIVTFIAFTVCTFCFESNTG